MNITIEECPQKLQEEVKKWEDRVSGAKIIAVKKRESTPYKDKSIVETTFKVYLQFGYEFLILSTSETVGFDSVLDGEIRTNIFNGGDITTIIENGDYIKDDLKRFVFKG